MKAVVLPLNSIHSGYLILINEKYPYVEDTKRLCLSASDRKNNGILLESKTSDALCNVMHMIGGWEKISIVSGWRSLHEQANIFNDSLKKRGAEFTEKFVAKPGYSEHQSGLAVDLGKKQRNIDFICPDFPYSGIYKRFRALSVKFGFIERYQKEKEKVTGIGYEPWHFRYVGIPHASIITEFNFALEEYVDFIRNYPYNTKKFEYRKNGIYVLISYIKANESADTKFMIDDIPYSVSGNNVDGFIVTEWRGMS